MSVPIMVNTRTHPPCYQPRETHPHKDLQAYLRVIVVSNGYTTGIHNHGMFTNQIFSISIFLLYVIGCVEPKLAHISNMTKY